MARPAVGTTAADDDQSDGWERPAAFSVLELREQIERWINLHSGSRRAAVHRSRYNTTVNDLLLRDHPEWMPPPDLVTLREYWLDLPNPVLPGIDWISDLRSGTGDYHDITMFSRSGYQKFVDQLPAEQQASAAMVPQATVNVFNTASDVSVNMETVGPASGAIAIYYLGQAGWIAKSLAELFDRACFLFEQGCCVPTGDTFTSDPDAVYELVGKHAAVNADRTRLSYYVQDCLVDLRLVGPGFDDETDWLRLRWEHPPAN